MCLMRSFFVFYSSTHCLIEGMARAREVCEVGTHVQVLLHRFRFVYVRSHHRVLHFPKKN